MWALLVVLRNMFFRHPYVIGGAILAVGFSLGYFRGGASAMKWFQDHHCRADLVSVIMECH